MTENTSYAVHAMTRLRAEIAGKIEYLHEQAEQAERELGHVDAVLHMLAPGLALNAVAAKQYPPRKRDPRRNGWARMVLDVLRNTPKSLTVDEIADEIVRTRFNGEMDRKQRVALEKRIDNQMHRLRDREAATAIPQESGRQAWRLV